jgi:hypothetical protein
MSEIQFFHVEKGMENTYTATVTLSSGMVNPTMPKVNRIISKLANKKQRLPKKQSIVR